MIALTSKHRNIKVSVPNDIINIQSQYDAAIRSSPRTVRERALFVTRGAFLD